MKTGIDVEHDIEQSSSEKKINRKKKYEGEKDLIENVKNAKKKKKPKISKEEQGVRKRDENRNRCLNYLKKWQEDRQNWKFEKCRQMWLFRNMFDPIDVPDSVFTTLVQYISGTKGNARQNVIEKTMEVIKSMEKWNELSQQGMTEEEIAAQFPNGIVNKKSYKRARLIFQSLEDD